MKNLKLWDKVRIREDIMFQWKKHIRAGKEWHISKIISDHSHFDYEVVVWTYQWALMFNEKDFVSHPYWWIQITLNDLQREAMVRMLEYTMWYISKSDEPLMNEVHKIVLDANPVEDE